MYSAADIDALLAAVVGWMFQVQVPRNLVAADQIFRTQVPPPLYASLQRTRGLIQDGGLGFTRQVANSVGYDSIRQLIPAARALLDAYEQGSTSPAQLARSFQALSCLAAVIDRQFRYQLTHATLAESAARTLEQRFSNVYTPDRWQREWAELQGASQAPAASQHSGAVRPLTTAVYNSGHQAYDMPTRLHMVDSISHRHTIEFLPPIPLTTYIIDSRVTIPWERINNQVLIDIGLTISLDGAPVHRRHRIHLDHNRLTEWKAARSAVCTTIGLNGQLRLYPEYFSEAPLQLPHSSVASIRAHAKGVDIRKTHPAAVITVLA